MFDRLSFLRRIQTAVAIAAIIFLLVLGALALRTALGKDPALGSSATSRVQATSAGAEGERPYGSGYGDDYGEYSGSADADEGWAPGAQGSGGGWDTGSTAPDSSAAAQAPMTTAQS